MQIRVFYVAVNLTYIDRCHDGPSQFALHYDAELISPVDGGVRGKLRMNPLRELRLGTGLTNL